MKTIHLANRVPCSPMRKVLGEFTNNKIFQYVHKHHTQKISNAYSIYVYKYKTHMIITNNCTKRGHVPIPKHEVPGFMNEKL